MNKHCVINGPNINLLGQREASIYGNFSYQELVEYTNSKAAKLGVSIDWFQSNIEGEIIDFIQQSMNKNYKSLIINPAGYSHTSVAIYDALKIVKIPVIEVHISNVHAREDFRQTLLTGKAARTIMSGFGKDAYVMAILGQEMENILT